MYKKLILTVLGLCGAVSAKVLAYDTFNTDINNVADVAVMNFDSSFELWQVEGDAFGSAPSTSTLTGQNEVFGYLGSGYVNSFNGGDSSTGKLTSPLFVVRRGYINFLIGGGVYPNEACVNLIVDGEIVRTQTASENSERLLWASWDVSEFAGKAARIEIVDNRTGHWGHILIDEIIQSNVRFNSYVTPELHFVAASGRPMGDPHPAFDSISGKWHLFYGAWHHATTTDFLSYEHLDNALQVSYELGEKHLFSGCALRNDNGLPVILYTSIGEQTPLMYSELWGAFGGEGFVGWTKFRENPLLTATDNEPFIYNFRDPFVFRAGGKAFMVQGGHKDEPCVGGTVTIFSAANASFTSWQSEGILLQDTEPSGLIECPFMFEDNGKWCLGMSTARATEYIIGDFDPATASFTPQRRGFIEPNRDYMYAPSIAVSDSGKVMMWGMMRGTKENFWAGSDGGLATLARELSISDSGRLLQNPPAELASIRTESFSATAIELENRAMVLPSREGDKLDLHADFSGHNANRFGFKLLCSADMQRELDVSCYRDRIEIDYGRVRATYAALGIERVNDLRVIVDKSIVEVYVNGGEAVMSYQRLYAPERDNIVKIFCEGGDILVPSCDVYHF
jgi:sucrose-6-phosphate hydrolase SacC (GH32 family)